MILIAVHILIALFPLVLMLTARSKTALRFAWRALIVIGGAVIVWSLIQRAYVDAAYLIVLWIWWTLLIRLTVLRWRMMKLMPIENKKRVYELL